MSLELRGNKAGRAEALRKRPHPMVPKQEEESGSGDGHQEQPMAPITRQVCGGGAGLS